MVLVDRYFEGRGKGLTRGAARGNHLRAVRRHSQRFGPLPLCLLSLSKCEVALEQRQQHSEPVTFRGLVQHSCSVAQAQ